MIEVDITWSGGSSATRSKLVKGQASSYKQEDDEMRKQGEENRGGIEKKWK